MGRRSDHTRAEIKEMAIVAAQRLLETEGHEALTTRRVAQDIGYTAGTLYNVFADREDLRLHVAVRSLEDLRRALAQARVRTEGRPGASTEDVVMALARAQLRFIRRHPVLWGQLFANHMPGEHELPAWYLEKVAATVHELELGLAPLFPDDPAQRQTYARVLWSGFFGLCQVASYKRLKLIAGNEIEPLTRLLVHSVLGNLDAPAGAAAG